MPDGDVGPRRLQLVCRASGAWRAGLQPLPETYVVLIQAHVAAGDVATAKLVYDSMQRGGYDPRCGWLMLTCELFRRGCAARMCPAGIICSRL